MKNGLNSDIGSRLRDERKRLGLSMSQAAVLVGLSSRTYIKIEHGAREITDLEAKLLRENGFQMDWIITVTVKCSLSRGSLSRNLSTDL